LYAGIAGGADVILIPEIPYDEKLVIAALKKRQQRGKNFSILAVAEGAKNLEEAKMNKKEYEQYKIDQAFNTVSYRLAKLIQEETGIETRVTIPGHQQRGGSPSPYDRVLATRLGAFAAKMIDQELYGMTASLRSDEVIATPLDEVAGLTKTVPVDHNLIKTGKLIGITFGDE
ncbi:MAG: 6-phosphofructokinase, partial [Vallitaleaceae bacterium]|nr:6-phosphofructokinase [Vallitaleaceae bacterium]